MRPGLGGVEFETSVYRPASYIDKAIDNVTLGAESSGRCSLALVVGAFFFRWRTALIGLVRRPALAGGRGTRAVSSSERR